MTGCSVSFWLGLQHRRSHDNNHSHVLSGKQKGQPEFIIASWACHFCGYIISSLILLCSKSRSIIALRGPGQFIGEVLLFDNTGRDSPMGSWQTCVRARTDVHALILTVKDLKELVTRKPAAEVELRAGQKPCTIFCAHFCRCALQLHAIASCIVLMMMPKLSRLHSCCA